MPDVLLSWMRMWNIMSLSKFLAWTATKNLGIILYLLHLHWLLVTLLCYTWSILLSSGMLAERNWLYCSLFTALGIHIELHVLTSFKHVSIVFPMVSLLNRNEAGNSLHNFQSLSIKWAIKEMLFMLYILMFDINDQSYHHMVVLQ